MDKLLSGKVCLITGSSKGIGRSIAEKFAEEGAIVYANARNQGSIDTWANSISEETKSDIIPLYFDVADHDAVKKAIIEIKKSHQKIDVLVNNAGIVEYKLVGMTKMEDLRNMLEINVVAPVHLIQLVSRLMVRQNSGSIINISSLVGVEGVTGQLAYSASKGAINAVTKSAAKELASNNIRVNAVAPGMVATERLLNVIETQFKNKFADIGMDRLAQPEEIANTCLFLASDQSEYITGQVIVIDGSTCLK